MDAAIQIYTIWAQKMASHIPKLNACNIDSVYYAHCYNFTVWFSGTSVFSLGMYYCATDSADLAVDYLYHLVNSRAICNTS